MMDVVHAFSIQDIFLFAVRPLALIQVKIICYNPQTSALYQLSFLLHPSIELILEHLEIQIGLHCVSFLLVCLNFANRLQFIIF